MKRTLSLCMIVKNESETLDRCLSSVYSLCDEIIIVDTGSIDSTKEIAKKYKAKVYDYDWVDDFSKARNYSFSLASMEYIIWLDADDVIKDVDKQKIQTYLECDRNWDVLLCRYIYMHDENGDPAVVLRRNRILKNTSDLKWHDPIHEFLTYGMLKQEEADIDIHHYRTPSQYKRSVGRNLKILENIYPKTKNPRHLYYYARELADNNYVEKAIKLFEQYIDENKDWEGNIINAYEKLSQLYYKTNQIEKAVNCCLKGIGYNPHYIELYNILSKIYVDKQDWHRVIRWCEMAITIPLPDSMHTYQPRSYKFVPYDRLSLAYYYVGEYEKAYEANKIAIENATNKSEKSRCSNNLKWSLSKLKNIDGLGAKLNLGCGSKIKSGYINSDIVKTEFCDAVYPLNDLPYSDETINEIYCEHSLEHLTHEEAKKAITEWARVMQKGGVLNLFVPDLELCCQRYLLSKNTKKINGYKDKDWFKYTIYGIQKDENGVSANYQVHKTGFSKEEITGLLESNGFIVDYCENY